MTPYKIYKARVTKISIPDNRGETQRKIYVSAYPPDGSGTWERPANPPNVFPTNSFGSGLISYPEVGQDCIVAEWRGERQILAYLPPDGLSAYGGLVPDNLAEGSLRFGIKGLNEALIKMTKEGQVTIYSQTFAQMGVDGSASHVFAKSKSFSNEFAGGFIKHNYDKEEKKTPSIAVYKHEKDNPVFSDHALRIEESTGSPLPRPDYRYKDKAIIRSGFIEDGRHPWELQTRQNIGATSSQDKNVVTMLRMGYQKEHERYGGDTYPAGTIVEFSAKKNRSTDTGLFKFRYGKLDSDTPNSVDNGEFLGLYAYEGVNKGKSFGSPITDALGEGKGWGVDYKSNAEQSYIHSIGRMAKKGNSFKRELLKDTKEDFELQITLGGESSRVFDLKHAQLEILDVYGGENLVETTIKQEDTEYLRVLTADKATKEYKFADFGVKETIDKKWSVEYEEGSSLDGITIEKDKISLKNDTSSHITLEGDKIAIGNDSGSSIEIDKDNIILKNSNGSQISIEGNKITIKTNGTTLEVTNTSFKVNNRSLLFEEIADALAKGNIVDIVPTPAGPGGPAKISATVLPALNLPTNRT